MHRHLFRRAPITAALASILVAGLLPTVALGTQIPARAALLPIRQFVGDATGRLLTFRVRNSGTPEGIGSVRIERPSAFWTETACPSAPAGWTAQLIVDACEYTSAPGNGDDIPLGQGRYFGLRATTAPSDHNVWGTWRVRVSPDDDLAPVENVSDAAPMGLGLRTRAFVFEVVDAVISDASATPGDPCPTSDKSADAGSTGNFVVVCGRNHGNTTLTPVNAYSKLLGSMLASHGTFTSGPIPASHNVVVLGNWSNVTVTSNDGAGKAMRLRIGAAANQMSPVRRIGSFVATSPPSDPNDAPVALDDGYTTNEDNGLVVISAVNGLLANDSDADMDPLSVKVVNGSAANVGAAITTANGGSVTVNADGTLVYTPASNFNGIDSFTYKAIDATTLSNSATVRITVNSVNDAPLAVNSSFSMNENTAVNYPIPGVLDDAADIDGDPLSAVLVAGPAHAASFTLNSNGSFSYQPVSDYTGDDSFTWKARDSSLADSNIATVSITVNNVGGGGGGGGGCLIIGC